MRNISVALLALAASLALSVSTVAARDYGGGGGGGGGGESKQGGRAAVEVEARRCIKRGIKEEAVGVVRKCDIAMAAVKCTEVPSMVTAIDIGAAAFGYTTITTDRAAGGGTDIGIAGIIDLFKLRESSEVYCSLATASGRRVGENLPKHDGALALSRRRYARSHLWFLYHSPKLCRFFASSGESGKLRA